MTEKQRPNITGKGPVLTREMLEVFKEIKEKTGSLSTDAANKLNAALAEKTEELEKIIKMAYLKTVKAGEIAWDCKEMAGELKDAVGAGDEAKAMGIFDKLMTDLNEFIHKIKTFVVRMT